jgi:hypothetical protein
MQRSGPAFALKRLCGNVTHLVHRYLAATAAILRYSRLIFLHKSDQAIAIGHSHPRHYPEGLFSPASHRACEFPRTRRSIGFPVITGDATVTHLANPITCLSVQKSDYAPSLYRHYPASSLLRAAAPPLKRPFPAVARHRGVHPFPSAGTVHLYRTAYPYPLP